MEMPETPEVLWIVFSAYAFLSVVDSLRDPPPRKFKGWKLKLFSYAYRPLGLILAFFFAAVRWDYSSQLATRYMPERSRAWMQPR